jgi:hypothetical protein
MEVDELRVGCNNMQATSKGIHDQIGCQCECENVCQHEGEGREGECQASSKLYTSVTKLWEEVVCLKGQYDEWHHRECLLRDCSLCGVDSLKFCPCEEDVNVITTIQW